MSIIPATKVIRQPIFYSSRSGPVNKLTERWRKRIIRFKRHVHMLSHKKNLKRPRMLSALFERNAIQQKDLTKQTRLEIHDLKRNEYILNCVQLQISLHKTAVTSLGLKYSNIANGIAIPGDLSKNRNKDFFCCDHRLIAVVDSSQRYRKYFLHFSDFCNQ